MSYMVLQSPSFQCPMRAWGCLAVSSNVPSLWPFGFWSTYCSLGIKSVKNIILICQNVFYTNYIVCEKKAVFTPLQLSAAWEWRFLPNVGGLQSRRETSVWMFKVELKIVIILQKIRRKIGKGIVWFGFITFLEFLGRPRKKTQKKILEHQKIVHCHSLNMPRLSVDWFLPPRGRGKGCSARSLSLCSPYDLLLFTAPQL